METKENTIVVPMPKTKEYTAITGEDNEVKAYLVKARKNGLGVNWVAIYQTALEWLAKTNLQNQEYRVLMYLMSKLDFENYIRVTQTSIADALKIKQSNVSRAIRGLIDHDIGRNDKMVRNGSSRCRYIVLKLSDNSEEDELLEEDNPFK